MLAKFRYNRLSNGISRELPQRHKANGRTSVSRPELLYSNAVPVLFDQHVCSSNVQHHGLDRKASVLTMTEVGSCESRQFKVGTGIAGTTHRHVWCIVSPNDSGRRRNIRLFDAATGLNGTIATVACV